MLSGWKAVHRIIGGWGGIRTPGRREPPPVFKTGALNHSATHPQFPTPYPRIEKRQGESAKAFAALRESLEPKHS